MRLRQLLFHFPFGLSVLDKRVSIFDCGSPACAVEWQGENTLWNDLDRCCLEVRKQLECKKEIKEVEGNKLNRVCSTGNGNVLKYMLNNQAFNYCKKQPIWS